MTIIRAETNEYIFRAVEYPPNGSEVLNAHTGVEPMKQEFISAEVRDICLFLGTELTRVSTGKALVTDIRLTQKRRTQLRSNGNEGFDELVLHKLMQRLFLEGIYSGEVHFGGIIPDGTDQAQRIDDAKKLYPGHTTVFFLAHSDDPMAISYWHIQQGG